MRQPRPRTIRSSIFCRRRASSSRRAITPISRFQRVATIDAPSASFRRCAATWFPALPPTCCARPRSWPRQAQDTSAYGIDIKYQASQFGEREVRAKFLDLSEELGKLGIWVRLHYVYPYPHVADVIPLMADGKILPYLDIPFQHASPQVLKNMRRPAHGEKTLERIRSWRETCPDLAIRSTFIVGFPGETEEDFQMLLDWLDEARIDRAGCFKYEPVAGARSNDMGLEPVPQEVKEARWHRFMQRQQKISATQLQKKVGKRLPVIIDEANGTSAKGRTKYDAPEIDGSVHIQSRRPLRAVDIVTVKVDRADAYDLYGQAV